MRKISLILVFLCSVSFIGWLALIHAWTLNVGEFKWEYLGNNISQIRDSTGILVGPCAMEIGDTSHVIYGNCDDNGEGGFFVIDKHSHKVIYGYDLHLILRQIDASIDSNQCFRFQTFQTRKEQQNALYSTTMQQGFKGK